MSFNASDISTALTLLNAAIAAASNAEKFRGVVAQAVAEGRDISDEELLQAASDLDGAIDAAGLA